MAKIISPATSEPQSLRVLMVEDSEDDALLTLRELKKGCYNPLYERVEDDGAMRKALKKGSWDVILSDYQMPKFNGLAAIALLKETGIDIPLIIVSGAIGEETAVECMRLGAHDYIMKNNLSRLCPAIARELEEADSRAKRKRAEDVLKETEERYRALFDRSLDLIYIIDFEGHFIDANDAALNRFGYTRDEIGSLNFASLLSEDQLLPAFEELQNIRETGIHKSMLELRLQHKDGSDVYVETRGSTVMSNGKPVAIQAIARDITERKRTEEEIKKIMLFQQVLMDAVPSPIFYKDADCVYIGGNKAFERYLGRSPEQFIGKTVNDIVPGDLAEKYDKADRELLNHPGVQTYETSVVYADGTRHDVVFNKATFTNAEGKVAGLIGVILDITERKQAEKQLQDTLESLRKSFNATIQVMVSAVEARDPYTSGHQIRSADLAQAIATETGLPRERIDGIRMAGSIHDIGKLSIPAEILSKPTKLTTLEFSLIKEHSRIGYEMLKDVESPWPLAQIVYQHHERIDGSGYPQGLKGDDILLDARIMSIADVVEAMASHRPYRPALGLDLALEEISRNKGIAYDADAVDACLKLFREKGYKLVEKA
jgi:PAS domain S-box-containing protein